ncbi:BRO family protein [Burkholderia multivorans]|uniref:BRO family protein n=1 Tax=Burkholderia multivorans TaxID=87883 RepID=UPI001C252D75|nr:BRO family protein [Burkholderia multivorans]MBU9547509.1 phage antirepressor [Burkholderia multivorans]
MNSLTINPFTFEGAQVRTVVIDNEPWFVAKDVAEILGYSDTNQSIRLHCKKATNLPVDSTGIDSRLKIIPESDMYRLIMRSKLPSAEKFEEWVVGTVLPSIRKTGAYGVSAVPPQFQIPQTYTEALRLAADIEEKRAALEIENAEKAKLIEEQKPAVEFAQAVQASDESISMGQLAKLIARQGIDIGERRLRIMLKEDGYLMKSGEPYQRYTEYFEMVVREWVSDSGRVHTGFTVRITPKGERYFLKRYGQKPVQVERKPNPPKNGLFKPRAIKE